jgi:hypothetical protein
LPPLSAAQKCAFGLASSRFNLFNYDRYDDWMDSSTRLEMPEVGVWEGVKQVEEYIRFLNDTTYFQSVHQTFNASRDTIPVRNFF